MLLSGPDATVNRSAVPPGSNAGWRWSVSPSSSVVTGSVTPPVEATCMMGLPSVPSPNTIMSFVPQLTSVAAVGPS